jgi:hypothetical protein
MGDVTKRRRGAAMVDEWIEIEGEMELSRDKWGWW